jgi:hypothetical protein
MASNYNAPIEQPANNIQLLNLNIAAGANLIIQNGANVHVASAHISGGATIHLSHGANFICNNYTTDNGFHLELIGNANGNTWFSIPDDIG